MCFWLTREVVSLQSSLINGLHKRSETSCVLAASHWLQGAVPQLFQPGVLPLARQSRPRLQGDNPSFLSGRAFLPWARESSENATTTRGGTRRCLRPARPRVEHGGSENPLALPEAALKRVTHGGAEPRSTAATIEPAGEHGGPASSAARESTCASRGGSG